MITTYRNIFEGSNKYNQRMFCLSTTRCCSAVKLLQHTPAALVLKKFFSSSLQIYDAVTFFERIIVRDMTSGWR